MLHNVQVTATCNYLLWVCDVDDLCDTPSVVGRNSATRGREKLELECLGEREEERGGEGREEGGGEEGWEGQ